MAKIAVGAVVFDARGRVLLVRRDHPPREGEWSLVGGRPEPGESLAEAIAREVLEETALRVRVIAELEVVTIEAESFAYAIHEFLCVPEDPDAIARAGSDARDVTWADAADLERLGLRRDARGVVDRARARLSLEPAGGLQ